MHQHFTGASAEAIAADEAADPERAKARAEASAEQRRRSIAKSLADQERHPERNEYAKLRRREAKAAGIPVIPMKLVRRMKRDPALVLHVSRGEMSVVPFPVLAARSTSVAAPQAPRRVNGPSGRPRSQASRSSSRSGDSGSSDDGPAEPGEPAAAPEAAREAVALCWEQILRRRTPGFAWEVVA